MSFEVIDTELVDLKIIKPRLYGDERGFFMEVYKNSFFEKLGIKENFVQINHSRSQKGVLRGLHYQLNPNAQSKLVRVIYGEVYDVVVDLRKGSPTYKKWFGQVLNTENNLLMYVPKGFAHGFCVLSDYAEFLYSCGSEYSPESEAGLRYDDPDIKIDWPLDNVILSDKDKILPYFKDIKNNFEYAK